MKKINLKKHNFHGEFNHTILPDMESKNGQTTMLFTDRVLKHIS